VGEIIDLVCKYFGGKKQELISRSRERRFSRVRSIIAYMVVENGQGTLSEYIKVVKCDLSTLSIGVRKIREDLQEGGKLQRQIDDLMNELNKQ